jgi:hypothetical protein
VLVVISAAVLVVGTMVTGSGPHAGDADARRNNLEPEAIAQAHADLVFLLIGLTIAAWFAFRAVGASKARQRSGWLFAILLGRDAFTNLRSCSSAPTWRARAWSGSAPRGGSPPYGRRRFGPRPRLRA